MKLVREKTMPLLIKPLAVVTSLVLIVQVAAAQERKPHNVILFVPDGMRALSITPERAPTMVAIRDKGVNFKNSHSLFPTFTPPTPRPSLRGIFSATPATTATQSMSDARL
jgi:Type I phosphodiesterase / nucleotide pyrophosphatase